MNWAGYKTLSPLYHDFNARLFYFFALRYLVASVLFSIGYSELLL